jgi:inner membrane protein
MKTSPMMRLLVMGLLLFALQAPLTMMCTVVDERKARRNAVVTEVSGNWGDAQTMGGPVLAVPYRYSWSDSHGQRQTTTANYYFLPEQLEIEGTLETDERKRTLFTVIVYTSRLKIRGRFTHPVLPPGRPVTDEVLWDQAKVNLGITDPRGIARAVTLTWNGQPQCPASTASACCHQAFTPPRQD